MDGFFIKVQYRKGGMLRFASHRDMIEVVKRSVLRAGLPVSYSQGFNPRPQISFYNPLQVGVASDCELFVLQTDRYCKPHEVVESLNRAFPSGLECRDALPVKSRKTVSIRASEYEVPITGEEEDTVAQGLEKAHAPDAYIIKERNGKKLKLRGRVGECAIEEGVLHFALNDNPEGALSTLEFLLLCFPRETAMQKLFQLRRCRIIEKVAYA